MWTALLALLAQKMLFMALHLESGSFPRPLPLKEERACFEHLHGGDAAEAKKARDTLIRHNLRLVSHIAKKYYAGGAQEQDDLVSIGTIGLIKAVDSFDHARANRFSTYAARCVENGILSPATFCRKHRPFALQKHPAGTS
jgi:RNA polymerase sporulation-specific sigma factor